MQVTSSAIYETTVVGTLTIGGVTGDFTVTTHEAQAGDNIPPSFVGKIQDKIYAEGEDINFSVAGNFSDPDSSLSYSLTISPSNPGVSISSSGVVTGVAGSIGKYRMVIFARDEENTAHSNLVKIRIVQADAVAITGEPIKAAPEIQPAKGVGLDNVIYRDTTNTVLIPSITGLISKAALSSASVVVVVESTGGDTLATINGAPAGDGSYYALIPNSASIDDETEVMVRVTIHANGAVADWDISCTVTDRSK
jgi:hypothetical protein